jgi:acyl-CoA thioesterase
MADLLIDSAVEPLGAGRYRTTLSPDWAVWGPYGGYVAAIALRAGLTESRFARPASFQCHFLTVAEFGPVELAVSSLGGGKRAESLRVDVSQKGRMVLTAMLWVVDEGLDGFRHESTRPPDVPGPDELKSFASLTGDEYAQWYPIWRSIEGRPVVWREPPGEPVWHCWMRLADTQITSATDDAIRQLFWLDLPGWNATTSAHAWPFPFLAPNLDLTVQFHRFDPEAEWMLASGYVPLASEGLLGCVSRLWSRDGRLLATGTSKHTSRRNPGYEQELAEARAQGLLGEDDPRR